MTDDAERMVTAFAGDRLLASGPVGSVALAVRRHMDGHGDTSVLVVDDADGRIIDLDLRGSDAEILARLGASDVETAPARSRGRPKLGVIGREITLLPRQWDWLARQPGGASVVIRRLVDAAERAGAAEETRRRSRDAAYRFMTALAGDRPGYEEATRALFAGDMNRLRLEMATWPEDIRTHALRLAGAENVEK
jgi:hypothetical protein